MVVSRCAHRGIANTVSFVVEYFNDDIYAVIGGTHLTNANRIKSTFNDLKNLNLNYWPLVIVMVLMHP